MHWRDQNDGQNIETLFDGYIIYRDYGSESRCSGEKAVSGFELL